MSASLSPLPKLQFFDANGNPLVGGRLYTFAAGTTTPLDTYTDATGTIAASNPIVLNGRGECEVWLGGAPYKFRLETSAGVEVWTVDDVTQANADQLPYTPAATSLLNGVVTTVSGALNELSHQSTGSTRVGFLQAGSGAQARTVQAKLRETVSVMDFGAVGDGVTDDTAAIHAAITSAIAVNGAVYFPARKYRVTSGYTNSTNNSVTMFGDGLDYYASSAATADGSCVILDSTDPNSFFYSQTAGNNLKVSNMQFACAQTVLDRSFFRQSAVSVRHIFENVHFANVERPFVYFTGCYFQLSSYTNVRFTNSGTFHSVVSGSGFSALAGTFMVIDNVDVEGFIPANSISQKVICNLQGIRQIQGRSFVIEPGTPDAGWIGLYMSNPYDADWIRFPTATFRGFWVEVTGSGLDYSVYQVGGRTKFIAPVFNNGAASPFRIDNIGITEISDTTFSGTSDPLQSYFNLNTYLCQVKLTNCNYRNAGTAINNPQFTFDNCSNSPSGGAGNEPFTATSHNNQQSELLWAFDGGYPDPGRVLAQSFGGTTIVPSVDAAFGRGLYINPSAGALQALFQGRLRGDFPQGGQMFVVVRGTLPNIPSGTLEMSFLFNGSSIGGGKVWTPADSYADFRVALPVTAQTVNPTTMGVTFSGSADTSPLKLYQLELWIGKSLPSVTMPSFPQNVQTYAASTPAAGEWARGDIIWNNAPSAGGTPGWVCTTGGTPGTWKAMANVAA